MNMHSTMSGHPLDLPRPADMRRRLRFWRLVSLFERDEVEDAVDALIAHLDARGGDPDLEANGDELDATCAEDEIGHPLTLGGFDGASPGCPISDPAEYDESQTDVAWREAIDQGLPQFRHRDGDPYASTAIGTPEDAEDDDPAEDGDNDRCAAGDDHLIGGPVQQIHLWNRDGWEVGDEHDAERSRQPASMDRPEPANAS